MLTDKREPVGCGASSVWGESAFGKLRSNKYFRLKFCSEKNVGFDYFKAFRKVIRLEHCQNPVCVSAYWRH